MIGAPPRSGCCPAGGHDQPPCTLERRFPFKMGPHCPPLIPLYPWCVWTILGSHSHSALGLLSLINMRSRSSIIQSNSFNLTGLFQDGLLLPPRPRVGLFSALHLIGYTLSCGCLQRGPGCNILKQKKMLFPTK